VTYFTKMLGKVVTFSGLFASNIQGIKYFTFFERAGSAKNTDFDVSGLSGGVCFGRVRDRPRYNRRHAERSTGEIRRSGSLQGG
jgi:hypothetical protein